MKAFTWRLTRVHTKKDAELSANPLRTTVVDGFFEEAPKVGQSFRFYSTSLTEGKSMREIVTSPIQGLRAETGKTTFWTLNSQYELVTIPLVIP